jgi:hypothetical protein
MIEFKGSYLITQKLSGFNKSRRGFTQMERNQ